MRVNLRRNFLLLACILMSVLGIIAQPHFKNKIPIPPLLDADSGIIELEMRLLTEHRFNPKDTSDTVLNGTANQTGIETWCYNLAGDTAMTFLGPTLKWHTGQMTRIKVTNLLPQATTTHWHGAEVPAHFDGGPHQPIAADSFWNVDFVNLDSASTMWYHPHFHNNTYPQVQLGLSGMIISEQASDAIRATLPHTYGVDDIPIIIGDQNFKYIDTLGIYRIDTAKAKRPFNLVNGVTNPYLEVPAHLVRLRILNGSTRKGLQLAVSDSYSGSELSSMEDFTLIATDGGYTIKPDTLKTLLNGPGGRDEIILDLTQYHVGDTLYLRNMKEWMANSIVGSPISAPNGGGQDTTSGNAFLQLRVVADSLFPGYLPLDIFTPFTSAWDPGVEDTLGVSRHRTKKLVFIAKDTSAIPKRLHNAYMIDSTTYDMQTINDTVCEGAKEIWTIHNVSGVAHHFHIHKIFFRILDIVDSSGTMIDLESLGLNGPKDDVLVRPGWKLRFLAKFDDYPNIITPNLGYMYHCHILTHEDSTGGGMMHQFVVTDSISCRPMTTPVYELKSEEMVLFPNPAGNELFMKGESREESTVRIVDLQGRNLRVQVVPHFNGTTAINIDGLQSGFYLVVWHSVEGVTTGKVLLQ